jgi:hypothetical protein
MIKLNIICILKKYILDTDTYYNFRHSCSQLKNIFNEFLIFENNKLIKKIKLEPDKIIIYDTYNNILEKYTFFKYGKYKYKKGNETVYNTIPFKLSYTNIENNFLINRKYDIKNNNLEETKYYVGYGGHPGCEIM